MKMLKNISRFEIEELEKRVTWLFTIRWFASIFIFVFILLGKNLLNLNIRIYPSILIPIIIFFYNFIFSFFIDNIKKRVLFRLLIFQLLLDITAIIFLNYFIGIEVNFAFISIFFVIFGGILLPAQSCIFITFYTIFLYNLIVFLEFKNFIPVYNFLMQSNYLSGKYLIINNIIFTLVILICSGVTISIMNRLRSRESQVINLKALAEKRRKEIAIKAEKLNKLNILKSSFMRQVEHQLKSPISASLSILDIFLKSFDNINDIEKKKFIQSILKKINLMQDMIHDLIFVSQLTDPDYNFETEIKSIDLNNLIKNIITDLNEFAIKQNDEIVFNPDNSLGSINLNEKYMNVVLTNIIHNAIKYTTNGIVTINTKRENEKIKIEISDTGIGIKPEEVDKIFNEFYRSSDVKSRGIEGTGLGLYIVKKILERMNGKIEVKSEYGKGTTFIIEI